MKWTYEKLMKEIDEIQDAYINDEITFEQKEQRENEIYTMSGWTFVEMMIEIESRI